MAIIYTYPELTSPQGGDLLLISDISVKNNPTNRLGGKTSPLNRTPKIIAHIGT